MLYEVPPAEAQAACSGDIALVHLFFSDDTNEQDRAKSFCATCPRRAACLAGAIERGEEDGIWGGYDYTERRFYVTIYGRAVGDTVRDLPVTLYRKKGRRA